MDPVTTFYSDLKVYFIFLGLISAVIYGFATQKIIEKKGYYENWFWWGFFFGIIALIMAAVRPENRSYYSYDDEDDYIIRPGRSDDVPRIGNRRVQSGEWKCAFCYTINQDCVTSCSCGKSKEDTQNYNRQAYLGNGNEKKESTSNVATETAKVENADPYEVIKKAKELLDMGIITQEEFNKKKSDLLGL